MSAIMKRKDLDFSKFKNEDLIRMVTEIKEIEGPNGKKIGTEGFAEYYHVDFNYNQATYELQKRGYKQTWCKASETNYVPQNNQGFIEINLSENRRMNLKRYQSTFSEVFINKLQSLVKEISQNSKKSVAIEMLLEPEVDRLLCEKERGDLKIKDKKKKVIEAEDYII